MVKSVFITGGTGFLGFNVINALLEKGYVVYAMTRKTVCNLSELAHQNLHIVVSDLEHLAELQVPNFDVCLSFAWGGVNRDEISNPDIQKQNVKNEEKLWEFSRTHGCSLFIDAGSRQEYTFSNYPLTEDSECNPLSEYGKGKLLAYESLSKVSLQVAMKYVHLRIFSIYGYGDHPWSLINTCIEKMLHNEDIELGACTQLWSFLHIKDFANAITAIIEHSDKLSNNEVLNIGSNDNRALKTFVDDIKSCNKSSSKLLYGAFKQNPESIKSIICDSTKIADLIGWHEEIAFKDGIKEIIRRKQNILK